MKTVTATIAYSEDRARIRLNEPLVDALGSLARCKQWDTGLSINAIYAGRKWFVVEYESIWDRGNGECVGTYYVAYDMTAECDRSDILHICDRLGVEPPAAIPEQEI